MNPLQKIFDNNPLEEITLTANEAIKIYAQLGKNIMKTSYRNAFDSFFHIQPMIAYKDISKIKKEFYSHYGALYDKLASSGLLNKLDLFEQKKLLEAFLEADEKKLDELAKITGNKDGKELVFSIYKFLATQNLFYFNITAVLANIFQETHCSFFGVSKNLAEAFINTDINIVDMYDLIDREHCIDNFMFIMLPKESKIKLEYATLIWSQDKILVVSNTKEVVYGHILDHNTKQDFERITENAKTDPDFKNQQEILSFLLQFLYYLQNKSGESIDQIKSTNTKQKRLISCSNQKRRIKLIGQDYQIHKKIHYIKSDLNCSRKSPAPHIRRGHLRSQACGKGKKDHKPVWIHPMFINYLEEN